MGGLGKWPRIHTDGHGLPFLRRDVANTLGSGFLEKVYERALLKELRLRGVRAVAQASVPVSYKGSLAGEFFADLMVEDQLMAE